MGIINRYIGIVSKKGKGKTTWSHIVNLGGLWMQSSQKRRFEAFIHNDEVICFHMALQGTQKMIVMGHYNFKDEILIKRWQVVQKLNGTGRKLRTKINEIIVKSCFHLLQEIVCFWKLWNLQKHECGECNQKFVESSKGERNIKR
jgi:hypothetical protein